MTEAAKDQTIILKVPDKESLKLEMRLDINLISIKINWDIQRQQKLVSTTQ